MNNNQKISIPSRVQAEMMGVGGGEGRRVGMEIEKRDVTSFVIRSDGVTFGGS
jgi:hypothetical protein